MIKKKKIMKSTCMYIFRFIIYVCNFILHFLIQEFPWGTMIDLISCLILLAGLR